MWPVMEAMSQDAIDEMVDNIFKMAKLRDGSRYNVETVQKMSMILRYLWIIFVMKFLFGLFILYISLQNFELYITFAAFLCIFYF